MNRHFVFHGTFLILVGILSVMYNPHSGLLGFNPDAKSGLIVSGAFALISFFWAFIYYRQAHRVAVIGGFITTILLFAGTIPLPEAALNYRASYEQRLVPVFRTSSKIRRMLSLPRTVRTPILRLLEKSPTITRYVVSKTR